MLAGCTSGVGVVVFSLMTVMSPHASDAFLSGAPGPRSPIQPSSKPDTKIMVDDAGSRPVVDGTAGSSPRGYEVISVGDPQVLGSPQDLIPDSDLTAVQARAIALEAANSKTVPKTTILEALGSLARSSEMGISRGEAPAPVEALDGVWRLCFCEGGFLDGIDVDKHGYLGREQRVEVRFNSNEEMMVLGSSGLRSALPKTVRGGLSYAAETQTITGTFEKDSVGIDTLTLRACLVDEDALGFYTVSQGNYGFLLFHSEKGKAAAARLSKDAVALPSMVTEARKAATASVAGKKKVELKVDLQLVSEEEMHEDKIVAFQEGGRKTGSVNTFMRYLETEAGTIYAVLAGPVLFSFMRAYSPYAATKATAAAIVLSETFRHLLEANA